MSSLFEDPSRESYETETPEPVFAGERLPCCEYCDHPVDGDWCERCEEAAPCPDCHGAGFTISLHPTCCGNFTGSGECRAWCAVPDECQEPCDGCLGTGVTPSTNRRARAGRLAS